MIAVVTPFHTAPDLDNLNGVFLAAAAADDIPALRRALADGAQINTRGRHKQTALMQAALDGRLIMAEILLAAGASFDLQDVHGRTALAYATRQGLVPMAALLIRAGADITIDDKDGDKPLDIALRCGNPAMVSLFEQPLKDLLLRIPAADTGQRLQNRRAPACAPDPYGDTMLTWAAREGQENVIRAMVQSGADVFIRNRAGLTPREVAEAAGHRLVVCLLEDAETRQLSRNAVSAAGDTAHPV